MRNSFGTIFKITTFGESHGAGVGVVIDGCPAGLEITREEIQHELDRRRPGQHKLTTQRQEKDQVEILSGIFEGKTLGTPIALLVRNEDAQSKSYENIKDAYRPGHADFVYDAKYGFRDWRGGGRASARETIGRVAASAIARKVLASAGVDVFAYVTQVGKIKDCYAPDGTLRFKISDLDREYIEENILHAVSPDVYDKFVQEIEDARNVGDSVGGVVEVVARHVPVGLGEPVFGKLSADLASAMVSIPAVKGFEIGDGFACASKRGSENNDVLENRDGKIATKTNHAGGIVGGISNGEDIVVRIALKPASSIVKEQQTVDSFGNETTIQVHGRHDPCVCSRAVPIAEAMMVLVLVDHWLMHKSSKLN